MDINFIFLYWIYSASVLGVDSKRKPKQALFTMFWIFFLAQTCPYWSFFQELQYAQKRLEQDYVDTDIIQVQLSSESSSESQPELMKGPLIKGKFLCQSWNVSLLSLYIIWVYFVNILMSVLWGCLLIWDQYMYLTWQILEEQQKRKSVGILWSRHVENLNI